MRRRAPRLVPERRRAAMQGRNHLADSARSELSLDDFGFVAGAGYGPLPDAAILQMVGRRGERIDVRRVEMRGGLRMSLMRRCRSWRRRGPRGPGHEQIMAQEGEHEQESCQRPAAEPPSPASGKLVHHASNRRCCMSHAAAPAGPITASGRKSRRRSSWAFNATTMVETLIRMAPTAGGISRPMGASTPAARGIARAL